MPGRNWFLIAVAALMIFGIAACNQTESGPSDSDTFAPAEGQADVGSTVAGQEGEPDQPVPMIASGSATVAAEPEATEGARPQPLEGVQRISNLEEARERLPFTLMEPQVLPENTFLTIVQLVEPVEGQESPNLPGVRLIYDVDTEGVLVLYQSPATGEPFEGDPITIGSATGSIMEEAAATVLTWEADGVRFELRGASGVGRDVLLPAAESLAPGSPDAASAGSESDEIEEAAAPTEAEAAVEATDEP